MIETPWGNAEQLRARRLPPGPGTAREAVTRNQRERLFGAMVIAVAEHGYEGASLANLTEISGVSRSSFYEHFAHKEECFLATIEALLQMTLERLSERLGGSGGSWTEQAQSAIEGFAELASAYPEAARMALLEVYAAGPAAIGLIERATATIEELQRQWLADSPGEELPAQMRRAIVGGIGKVIQARLLAGETNRLVEVWPDVWAWGKSYRPPPRPLHSSARRGRVRPPQGPPIAGHDLAERILRAVATVIAERGYGAATIGEFAARARISQSTFYTHFESKEDAAMAALDAALAQMLAAVQPAARRAPDWPHGARAAMGALCSFGAAEPAFAGLAIVEVYAMGKAALEARDRAVWPLGRLIDPALERLSLPVRRPILLEVLAGAIYTLAYDQVRGEGPQSLPQIAPLATYMLLAPFLGAEEACEVANSDGRRRA